jgi:hypothetical protein
MKVFYLEELRKAVISLAWISGLRVEVQTRELLNKNTGKHYLPNSKTGVGVL